MDTLLQDLRYALRNLARRPGFLAAAVVALALGTGANTVIFSVVNGVLLRSFPFDADRIVVLRSSSAKDKIEDAGLSRPDLADVRAGSRALAAVTGVGFTSYDLTGTDRPAQLRAGLVSEQFFQVFDVRPLVGRVLTPDEIAQGAPVALLDETFWRSHFSADPGIVNRAILLDGKPVTVVGVLPHVRWQMQEYEMWAPLPPSRAPRGARSLHPFGRLAPGASVEDARRDAAVIARRLAAQYPKESGGWDVAVRTLREWDAGRTRPALLVLLGAVGLVLLIACTNVAHMLLARAAERGREIAVRASLGATRGRIVRQLLTESVLLAFAGSAAGLLLAVWLLPSILAVAPLDEAQRASVSMDGRVLAFTVVVAATAGVLFGLVPAARASRPDVQEVLKGAGGPSAGWRAGWGTRGALVVSEVALASVLLAGAGLLLRSFERLQAVERGYDPSSVVTTGLVLPDNVYPTGARRLAFFDRVLGRLRATPGVEVAAAVNFPPNFGAVKGELVAEGRGEATQPAERFVDWRVATPGYFRALRIAVIRGRTFDDGDVEGRTPVAVINRALAGRYFPGEDPVGRDVRLTPFGPPVVLRVIGVVDDVRNGGRQQPAEPEVYLPYAQYAGWSYMNVVVRGAPATPPATLIAAIRGAVREADPVRPTFAAGSLADAAERDVAQPRFSALLMLAFAGVAVLLSCVGIAGVTAYAVSGRTREIGIRVALGARGADVLRLVLAPTARLVAWGLAIGALAALALSRTIRGLLFGVSPLDPASFLAAALLLGAVSLIATYLPARRAARVQPGVALRYE